MRDTIIALLVMSGIVGGYLYMKQAGLLPSSIQNAANLANQKSRQEKSRLSQHKKSSKGATHDHSNHDQQTQIDGQDEGASGDVAEAESLPSIYKSEGFSKSAAVAAGDQGKSRKSRGKKLAKKKVIHGVPIQDFIDSRQNAISMNNDGDEDDLGVRVILQCHELKKKGPEYVGKHECQSLLAHGSNESPVQRVY